MSGVFPKIVSGKNVLWRYSQSTSSSYDICQPIQLIDGLVYVHKSDAPIDLSTGGWIYQSLCYNGNPVLTATNYNLRNLGINRLPMGTYSWYQYLNGATNGDMGNGYRFSIFSIVYSLCAATVITCFLTVVMFTKRYLTTQRPSLLLQLSSAMSSILLIAIYSYTLNSLTQQHRLGQVNSDLLITELGAQIGFNVIYLICYLLLQLCQVQLVMRLYSRTKEKRVIFFAGVFFSVLCEVIWACSIFLNDDALPVSADDDDDDGLAIIPAFIYLLRISLAVIYSCLVSAYCFVKRSYAFKEEVKTLTFVMFIAINLSIGFFIADIANVWVSETSDVFNVTCYVVSNIVSWEWINRITQFEKFRQKDGILGRQFFEDEMLMNYKFDGEEGKYLVSQQSHIGGLKHKELNFSDDTNGSYRDHHHNNDGNNDNNNDDDDDGRVAYHHQSVMRLYKDKFFDYVDRFIAAGLVFPKDSNNSSSARTELLLKKLGFQFGDNNKNLPNENEGNDSYNMNVGTSHSNSVDLPNQVYIYTPKEVDMEEASSENNLLLQRPASSHYPNLERGGDFYSNDKVMSRITTSTDSPVRKTKSVMKSILHRKKPVITHDNSRFSVAGQMGDDGASGRVSTGDGGDRAGSSVSVGRDSNSEYSMTEERLLADMLVSANNAFGIEGSLDYDEDDNE